MRELVIFRDWRHARNSGFVGPRPTHPRLPEAVAWWPSLGTESLRGLLFERVTVLEKPRRSEMDEILAWCCDKHGTLTVWIR